jgi:LysM repeat protein
MSRGVYARRRLAAVGLLVAILALAVTAVVGATGSPAEADLTVAGAAMEPQYIIAQPGDTLWAIAQRIAPLANTADLVDELVRLNGDQIAAGQQVRIP